jgi:hypothetical protein
MEQLGGIAIENRWPFALGCRCELAVINAAGTAP